VGAEQFTVEEAQDGATLAAALRAWRGGLTWSRARSLCERGKVTLDGEPARDPSLRVRRGQRVAIDERAPAPKPPVRAPIVFEDAHVVVIDKPSGVSSVPYEEREGGTAMDLLRDTWRITGTSGTRTANQIPLHVVHRIDKDTSGLLMFAKTKTAERAFAALFRAHAVDRLYRCVVHGHLNDRRIETRLVDDRGDGLRGSTRKLNQGKRAVTHVRVLEEMPTSSLCEVRLETGKTHQIRIHLAEQGHPLVGERVYVRDFLKRGAAPIDSPRLLLHAATLGFEHPISKKKISLESELPPEFERMLAKLRRVRPDQGDASGGGRR
jgi:23S rRNA pseudouridine1911/1915/1917 synthase